MTEVLTELNCLPDSKYLENPVLFLYPLHGNFVLLKVFQYPLHSNFVLFKVIFM